MQKLELILKNSFGENFEVPPLGVRLKRAVEPFHLDPRQEEILLWRINRVIEDELTIMAEEFKQIYYPNTITINQHGQQL